MLSLDTKPSFHDLSPLLANPLSAAVAQQQPGPPAASSSSSTEQSAASAFAASTSSSSPYDEITTIFVVGFPEDIQEREFQNMFTFASGFEAATLKFPANFDADDGIPAYKKQIIGFAKFRTRKEANYARDYLTGRKVDSERGSVLKAEIAKKNLHIKRPSNLNTNNVGMIDFIGSANPLSATPYGIGSVLQYNAPIQSPGLNSGVPQNQQPLRHPSNSMSAFTNRSVNLANSLDNSFHDYSSINSPLPWDILNDSENDQALQYQQPSKLSSSWNPISQQQQQQQQQQHQLHRIGSTSSDFETPPPSFQQLQSPYASTTNPQSKHNLVNRSSPSNIGSSKNNLSSSFSPSSPLAEFDAESIVEILNQPPLGVSVSNSFRRGSTNNSLSTGLNNGSGGSFLESSTQATPVSTAGSDDNKQPTGQATPLPSSPFPQNPRFASRMNSFSANSSGFNSALFNSESLLTLPAVSGLKINTRSSISEAAPMTAPTLLGGTGPIPENNVHQNDKSFSLSISIPSSGTNREGGSGPGPSLSASVKQELNPGFPGGAPFEGRLGSLSVGIPSNLNMANAGFRSLADQNPPCNTLYVGNLATNTNESELRDLFSRCVGYKRMSFRQRSTGPMVFVEFENIQCAQQALGDLHGTLLSTSMKGGIRLSFSKNPLGVRPSGMQSAQGNGVMPPSPWEF